jgi:hypothetical protein
LSGQPDALAILKVWIEFEINNINLEAEVLQAEIMNGA